MSAGKSILVVDDSRDLLALIQRAFGKVIPGTVIFPFSSGEEAVAHLMRCGRQIPLPELVLVDLHMPGGIDGFETIAQIRGAVHLAELPLLVFSDSDDEEHVARARQVGADGYVRKPVVFDDMAIFARAVMEWTPAKGWRAQEIVRACCAPRATG